MNFKLCCLPIWICCTITQSVYSETPNDNLTVFSKGNGTWLYDAQYSNGPNNEPYNKAGLWSQEINSYNYMSLGSHKINQLFSYGGDMEMDCVPGNCKATDLYVYYYPAEILKKPILQIGDSGFRSSIIYSQNVYLTKEHDSKPLIIPIIDGRIDSGELKGFNQLSQEEAQIYADNVARVYCSDDSWAGIQFDIEPFNMDTKNGQYYFYEQIAKNFSGNNPEITSCKDKAYPKGRFFSVFTFAEKVNANVANIFNQYKNGYVVDSLYDLGPNAGGIVNSPIDYAKYVNNEIQLMHQVAQNYEIYYQFAIPAAASVHEFEKKDNVVTGFKQIEYVQIAIETIDKVVRNDNYVDPFLLGINIWGWSSFMQWPAHSQSGSLFQPSDPLKTTGNSTLEYLSKKL